MEITVKTNNMETKICTKCGKNLPITEYYTIKSKYAKTYTYNYCRKCHYEKMTKHTAHKWRKDNPKRWSKDVQKAQQAMFGRDRKGVYLLVTTKGLYVGSTDKYEHRIKQHRNSDFKGNMKHKGAFVIYAILLEEIDSKRKRLQREKYWIAKLRPRLNIVYNPDYQKTYLGSYEKK
jgi:predicted GIY-YIG superfamily endonuclease/ribosomal protein L40E